MKKGELNTANIKRLKQFLDQAPKEWTLEKTLATFCIQGGFTWKKVQAYYEAIKK